MYSRRGESSRRTQTRLPVIAPRHEAGTSLQEGAGPVLQTSDTSEGPRSRVPPRSRSGCWTCRQRKVKCDEQRPTCGQCLRLNHQCDYNPRLAFRDDTPRVKERMTDIRSEGNVVWDPYAPRPDFELDPLAEDILPAFAALNTDEERERKALSTSPGTYLVVANPSSFANLPEYSDGNVGVVASSFPGRENPFSSSIESNDVFASLQESSDPNVVILRKFEESVRRGSTSNSILSANPSSPTLSFHSQSQSIRDHRHSISSQVDAFHHSPLEIARRGGADAPLLSLYRTEISPLVINVGNWETEEDMFESTARTYPPLFHAMMAISALNQAQRSGIASTAAMVHYDQVIISLREVSEQSSISDGALFTHYLLLLYEVAHAGSTESAMWSHHCVALLRIITERQQMDHETPHPFVVWMICLIDLYALFSGCGSGLLVRSLMAEDMIPKSYETLPALGPNSTEIFFSEEMSYLPVIVELNRQVVLLAISVATTARDLRAEEDQRRRSGPHVLGPENLYLMNRRNRMLAIQDLCRTNLRLWERNFPQYWQGLPSLHSYTSRSQELLHHCHGLYRACVVYAHTSMYPGQMTELTPEYATEVPDSISRILSIAMDCINTGYSSLKCLTFSLFLAGFAATDANQKRLAVSFMKALEPHNLGGNTRTLRKVLEQVYLKQQMGGVYDFSLDWVAELAMTGRGLIMFGL